MHVCSHIEQCAERGMHRVTVSRTAARARRNLLRVHIGGVEGFALKLTSEMI